MNKHPRECYRQLGSSPHTPPLGGVGGASALRPGHHGGGRIHILKCGEGDKGLRGSQAASAAVSAATSLEISPSWAWGNSICENVTLDSANSPSGQGAETVCHSRVTQDCLGQALLDRDPEQHTANNKKFSEACP